MQDVGLPKISALIIDTMWETNPFLVEGNLDFSSIINELQVISTNKLTLCISLYLILLYQQLWSTMWYKLAECIHKTAKGLKIIFYTSRRWRTFERAERYLDSPRESFEFTVRWIGNDIQFVRPSWDVFQRRGGTLGRRIGVAAVSLSFHDRQKWYA